MTIEVQRGDAPLVLSFPHSGTDIPADIEAGFLSPWLARRDTDWWIHELYGFAAGLGATIVRTTVSRSVIDVNRDPSGASLYPGQATTGLCPLADFDGDPLYRGDGPDGAEIARCQAAWFDPYHAALGIEIARLRAKHGRVVLYDAHSIRSRIPRLFDGRLPQFSIGTNDGRACDVLLADAIAEPCVRSGLGHVRDGRFKGGWITRHHGRPAEGVHAVQMELAMRGYMPEPDTPAPGNWPVPIDPDPVVLPVLRLVLSAVLTFAKGPA